MGHALHRWQINTSPCRAGRCRGRRGLGGKTNGGDFLLVLTTSTARRKHRQHILPREPRG